MADRGICELGQRLKVFCLGESLPPPPPPKKASPKYQRNRTRSFWVSAATTQRSISAPLQWQGKNTNYLAYMRFFFSRERTLKTRYFPYHFECKKKNELHQRCMFTSLNTKQNSKNLRISSSSRKPRSTEYALNALSNYGTLNTAHWSLRGPGVDRADTQGSVCHWQGFSTSSSASFDSYHSTNPPYSSTILDSVVK